MNDEEARPGLNATTTIRCSNCSGDSGLSEYGGEWSKRCPECGTRTPSQLHLDRHLLRQCCGLLRRAA